MLSTPMNLRSATLIAANLTADERHDPEPWSYKTERTDQVTFQDGYYKSLYVVVAYDQDGNRLGGI